MFISDLSYLDVVSNASAVTGGRGRSGFVFKNNDIAVIKQVSYANAYAKAYKGDAKAVAISVNYIGEVN